MERPWLVSLILLAGVAVPSICNSETTPIFEDFYNEYVNWNISGLFTREFKKLIDELSSAIEMGNGLTSQFITCGGCNTFARAVFRYYRSGGCLQELKQWVISTCVWLKIQTKRVCTGVIDLNWDVLVYIISNTPNLTPEEVCGTVLQNKGCSWKDNPAADWTVNVCLGQKPSIGTTRTQWAADAEILTIVQLTDIHYDPTYVVGGNAACIEPECCRCDEGPPNSPEEAAGYWGDYRRCDLPLHVFQDTMEQIMLQHPHIDYIYMTGDLVDHRVWETSRESNENTFNTVLTAMKTTFGDIPVFPALGNHEPSPLNVFAPVEITDGAFSTEWLYEAIVRHWSQWLPEDTASTILRGGFYTTLARPGLRIVTLNNNVCYTFNWWLLYNSQDPSGQLQWLAETLLQAEKDGEKVHILAHIPPGDGECHYIWSREFRKIIDRNIIVDSDFGRFEQTVTAHFNGHTHNDEFHLFYALDDPTRANNVAFDGGSVTPYSDVNPNYRVYKVDAATGIVLDHETWIYNLTAANLNTNQKPNWFKLYSFREAYGVESMTPTELDKLVHRMATDHELLQQYQRYFVKLGDPLLANGCDSSCLQNRLCGIVMSDATDRTQCEQLLAEFKCNKDK